MSNSRVLKTIISLLAFTIRLTADQADQGQAELLKSMSLEQLAQVEVTIVAKQPVQLSRTPAAVYVITQDEIRRFGATSLPEALRLAPGVIVARIDGVKWSIGIRGFGTRLSRDILVLIDGRTVYSPLFHGVYWEVQDVLMEDIDRIEVVRGPGGTIWGANAVNGVIGVITKRAGETKGILVSSGGGDVNQGTLDLRYGGSQKNLDYRVYWKGTTRGPEFHPDQRNFDDWRRTQGGFRVDWNIDRRDTLTFQGDVYDSLMGERTGITNLSPPYFSIVDSNALLSGGNVLARWERNLDDGTGFYVQAYFDRVNRKQASQAEFRDTFDIDFVDHLRLPGGHELTWGAGARISPAHAPTVVPTYAFTPAQRTDQVYTGFVQDQIPLVGDQLSLTLGSKLLHSSFSGFDAEPSARLLWTPTSQQTLWTAVTRAVRTPSDIEDDLENVSFRSLNPLAFNVTTGDGQFHSEILIGFEAGYRRLLTENISLDLSVFRNNYNHLLSTEPGMPYAVSASTSYLAYPFTNNNLLEGNTTGFGIIPNLKPRSWWRIQPSYSYLHMDLHTTPGGRDVSTVHLTEGSSPHHQVLVQSYMDLPRNLEFTHIYRYVSELPAQLVPAYHTGDARVSWRPGRHLEFAVTGQNLFQPHHPECGGDFGGLVGIKRNVYAAITWR